MTEIEKLPVPLKLAVPAPLADAPLTVSAPPVGAAESFTSVSVGAVVALPAASAPVTPSVGDEVVPSAHVKTFESYGPPPGVLTVLGACDQPLVVPPSAVVVLDAGPEPASETALRISKLPPDPPP